MPFIPVRISDKAIREVKTIMERKAIPEAYGLRIGIRGAGCAGISYMVGFDIKKDSDLSFEKEGIMVLIEKKHVMYLVGVELDFYDGTDERGFTFVTADKEKTKIT